MVAEQRGRAESEARIGEATLKKPRGREDEGQGRDDRHVLVGARQGTEAMDVQGMAHGDVTVDGEEGGQPRVGEAQEVDDRKQVDEHARVVDVDVGGQRVRAGQQVDVDETPQKEDGHEDQRVAHGQRLQQHCRRHPVLLTTQHDEGDGVGEDPQYDERCRDDDVTHELQAEDFQLGPLARVTVTGVGHSGCPVRAVHQGHVE